MESATSDLQKLNLITLLAKEYAETHSDSALTIAKNALQLANQNQLHSEIGQVYIATSTAWSFLGKYDSAMKYSFLALREAEKYQDTLTMIDAYNNIGIDNMYQEFDQKAIEYFIKVEQLSKLYGDSIRYGHVLNNLGMMSGFQEQYEKELEYYERAAAIFLAIDVADGYANALLNKGTVFTTLEEYDKAEDHYEESLEIFERLNHSSGIQNTIQSWAENALESGQIKKAEMLAKKALEIAKESSLSQDIIYTCDLLEKIALANQDYEMAYRYEIEESSVREELFSQEKARQIRELETKYETEKNKAEIIRLSLENEFKDQRMMVVGIAGGLFVILIITFFTLRSKKLKVEAEAQELQIEAMKKRLMELNATTDLGSNLNFEELNGKLHTPLTEREFEALKLSVDGKTNSEIAESLFISNSTVKFHLRNAFSKMGVTNRKEAFQYVTKTS
ncbi:MAG: tetratricopeptide repeat protein [Ekhidna sp.]